MPARKLEMETFRKILRLKHDHSRSHREIADDCSVSPATVSRYLERAVDCGLGWPPPPELDDATLASRLFPEHARTTRTGRPGPNGSSTHTEPRIDALRIRNKTVGEAMLDVLKDALSRLGEEDVTEVRIFSQPVPGPVTRKRVPGIALAGNPAALEGGVTTVFSSKTTAVVHWN